MNALLISLLFGTAIALAIWVMYRIFDDVDEQDRSYLDRPPFGFRLGWPLIKLIVHYGGHLITDNYRYSTQLRLRKAGVDYCINAEQFFAAKCVAVLFGSLLCYLLLSSVGKSSAAWVMIAAIVGFYYPEIWLKRTMDARNNLIFKALPFYLDIITLAVEAGTNLTNGINQAVLKAPEGPLRIEFGRVLRDIRAGKARAESLRNMVDRANCEGLANVVSSMIQAEKTGASLGPVLRAQSDQIRSNRFLKAEKLAMEAPVKLLAPLVIFIFPTVFMVIGFVVLAKALNQGLIEWEPLVWAFNNP